MRGKQHHIVSKGWTIRRQIFRLSANKQAADHYWLMNADRVKVNLSSADVMAAAGTVARRPEVGRCRRRVSGSAVK